MTQGRLVSLDGVHPTTSGYSIVAHECVQEMRRAGVPFPTSEPELDFAAVARADTLLTNPLRSLSTSLDALGWLDDRFALIARAERALRRRKRLS